MDSQFVKSKVVAQRLVLVVIGLMLVFLAIVIGIYSERVSDPYIREVLSLHGDLAKGHAIFQINCAGCHGWQADGSIGPSLHDVPKRRSKISLIHQVTSGNTPPMPKFQPTSQEMADLLTYLENL